MEFRNILRFGEAAKTFCSERVARVLCLHAGTSKTQTEEKRKKEVEEVKGKRRDVRNNEKQKSGWSTEEKRECRVKTLGILSSHLGKGPSGVCNWIHISGRAMG